MMMVFFFSVYANADEMTFKDFLKKLIENNEKSKITSTFNLNNKKAIKDLYNKLNNIVKIDSISLQEVND